MTKAKGQRVIPGKISAATAFRDEQTICIIVMRLFAFHIPSTIPFEDLDFLVGLLDPKDQDGVKRYRRAEDRARSLVGRLSLWWYLLDNGLIPHGTKPTFGRQARGKPVLATPALDPSLGFNNSHEGAWVLLGVQRGEGAEVGVDLMVPPPDPVDVQDGISLQLTHKEKVNLAVPLTTAERAQRLTTLWTLKEGYTKAVGQGIVFGMERIEVDMGQKGEVWDVCVDGRPVGLDRWKYATGRLGKADLGDGGLQPDLEGLGEGAVAQREGEEVGWAAYWRGQGEWDGQVRVVQWDELVRTFERKSTRS